MAEAQMASKHPLHSAAPISPPASPTLDANKGATSFVSSLPDNKSSSSSYPSPPLSASARSPQASPEPAKEDGTRRHHRRVSSLGERFPGDMSHRPLDVIRKDSLRANRSRHLRKAQHHGSDSIDRLDASSVFGYHHEGPYDAASLARNLDPASAPLAALVRSNREALRATPREKVVDSIRHHRPLDGTAFVPPGLPGPDGKVLRYEEGTDMMRFDGNEYKRWPGMRYHPDDLKGKGEPSFSLERALKDSKGHRRVVSDSGHYELKARSDRSSSLNSSPLGSEASYTQWADSMGRSGSKGKDFVKRLGSLRRRHARPEEEPLTVKVETRIKSA